MISRVRAGEAEAFGLLVERYYARCAAFAARLLGDHDDAADAVQDAFLRAYLSLDRYEEHERFGAWLLCIVANRCHSMADSARRRAHVAAEWCRARDEDASAPVQSDHALARRLAGALSTLPPDMRAAIVRKYAGDNTYEEIASGTGASVSALKMRVARGSSHLRRVLAGAALTVVASLLVVTTHRPHAATRRSVATVGCDTLRTLIHDTGSARMRDSLLPPGQCAGDSTAAEPRRSIHARQSSFHHPAP